MLPRLKNIASQKLSRPEAGNPEDYQNLQPILSKVINWDLIRNQYDEMVKYATALRLGTADTEAILQRFTRNNLQHPTYQALSELGRVIKTIFLCHYLESEESRREIKDKYTDRGVRKMLARYAQAAGITRSVSPHKWRHFLFTWLKKQGIDDALIQPYSGHESRQSLEIYSKLSLADAQQEYDQVMGRFPIQ